MTIYDNITDKVANAILTVTGVDFDTVKSRCKRLGIVDARTMFAYQLRKQGYTLVRIGEIINRKHAAVRYLCGRYNNEYAYHPLFRAIADEVNKIITENKNCSNHESHRNI